MNANFTNKIRNSWPPGLLRPQTTHFSAVGACRPVSRRRRCSRAMAHRVTVQPLTKKTEDFLTVAEKNQFLPPIPFPPRSAGGRETFFVGLCRRATPACKAPLFFLPSPTAHTPLGRGPGVGQKLQFTKVHPSPSGYLAPGCSRRHHHSAPRSPCAGAEGQFHRALSRHGERSAPDG